MTAAAARATALPWHADAGALRRFVSDLVAAEVAHLRPGGAPLPPRPWPDELPLAGDGLGLDSLERLTVASALNEALHLHESGLEDLLLARRTVGEWVQVAAQALSRFDARITFHTSGSSGRPKPCTHDLAALQQEAANHALRLPHTRRVLAAVPAHHIYGFLFTVLLPQHLGGVDVMDMRAITPPAWPRVWRDGDLLVSHPAHWALLARHVGSVPPGVVGVTSTAPCPDDLALSLRALGLQRLLQVYGSSETAGIGCREAPGEPYELLPWWSHAADGGDTIVRQVAAGGPARPAVLPQDHLAWRDDRHFDIAGRRDHAVQVAGINVFPARVREVLLAHPDVADAAVRLMQPGEGKRLKAYVVPRAGAVVTTLTTALDAYVRVRLSEPERPRSWTFGERLLVDERGKACDWPVHAPSA